MKSNFSKLATGVISMAFFQTVCAQTTGTTVAPVVNSTHATTVLTTTNSQVKSSTDNTGVTNTNTSTNTDVTTQKTSIKEDPTGMTTTNTVTHKHHLHKNTVAGPKGTVEQKKSTTVTTDSPNVH